MKKIRILNEEEVKKSITMKEAIEINKKSFQCLSKGEVNCPPRLFIDIPKYQGTTILKPSYIYNNSYNLDSGLGFKIVGVRPNNILKKLPTVPGFIMLLDEETNYPITMMDGTYLTALRTAAGSAVATELLSRKDSKTLVIFGAGMQARYHIEAICCIRNIQEIIICNRTKENAEKLLKEIMELYPNIHSYISLSYKEAIQKADIIVTATNSSKPLFHGGDISKTGVHINAIGSFTPTMQEIDEETIKRSKIIFDTELALESGDLYIPLKNGIIQKETHILGEIGKILNEKINFVRNELTTDITLFKSVGIAVQDIAVALQVLKNAEKQNLGIMVNL